MSDEHARPGHAQQPGRAPAPALGVAPDQALARVQDLADDLVRRRSVRDFAPTPIPDGAPDEAIRVAASAPSGAHVQPWRFVVVEDPAVRRRLREAAEAEEREFYERRASAEWLDALGPLGTDATKPFLTDAPALIVVLEVHQGPTSPRPYYVKESVGIAVGFLLAALHRAGLSTLTHTPSPMKFLNEILGRPAEERGFLVVPVGYPASDATVPALERKSLDEVRVRIAEQQ